MSDIHIQETSAFTASKKPITVNVVLFKITTEDEKDLNTIRIFDKIYPIYKDHNGYYINLETLHGVVRCSNNTYVVSAPQGDVYPHTYKEFHENYNVDA